ncbi:hypothetical protein EMPS_01394 [Entomortierella parvispora]|uniref:Transmembrane protein n=1 Tax=Entomortierella parvispora TaxID=205924 RepID=A0A9P3H2T1_9FUNG|nr:hypothetical protein EMPS_01394 [Entomortierella parvispora]
MYQPDSAETGSLFISLACISVMALLFGRKTAGTKLSSINYARGLVVALYMVSWVFSLIASMLVQTNDGNLLSCQLSILSCIALYALSKIIIYLFLMEKVYVVTAVGQTRSNFFLYKVNLALMLPYVAVITLMVVFRVASLDDNNEQCFIGLKRAGALPLILYDLAMSTWLTYLFLRPLMSSTSLLQGPSKGKLRDVARRTLMGSVVSMMLSSANIFTLVYFNGWERGLTCLSCCTVDVTLNAITVHWVTSRGGSNAHGGRLSNQTSTADGKANPRRRNRNTGAYSMSAYGVTSGENKKQVGPLETHISVSVETYVEEYHQLHLGQTSSTY